MYWCIEICFYTCIWTTNHNFDIIKFSRNLCRSLGSLWSEMCTWVSKTSEGNFGLLWRKFIDCKEEERMMWRWLQKQWAGSPVNNFQICKTRSAEGEERRHQASSRMPLVFIDFHNFFVSSFSFHWERSHIRATTKFHQTKELWNWKKKTQMSWSGIREKTFVQKMIGSQILLLLLLRAHIKKVLK